MSMCLKQSLKMVKLRQVSNEVTTFWTAVLAWIHHFSIASSRNTELPPNSDGDAESLKTIKSDEFSPTRCLGSVEEQKNKTYGCRLHLNYFIRKKIATSRPLFFFIYFHNLIGIVSLFYILPRNKTTTKIRFDIRS